MRRTLAAVILGPVVILACSTAGPTQSRPADVLAQQIASEHLIDGIVSHLKLSGAPYASPIPTDVPLDFLIAAALYDANPSYYALRIHEASYYLALSKGWMNDVNMASTALSLALKGAQASMKAQEGSDTTEQSEISRYDKMNPSVVTEIQKAAARLGDAREYELLLRVRVTEALAQQPELQRTFANRKDVSDVLRQARQRMTDLIKRTQQAK